MASLIFAHAKKIRNTIKKDVEFARKLYGDDADVAAVRSRTLEREITEFGNILEIAQLLHEKYEEVTGGKTRNWYFVTVRPKPGVTFEDFYILTYRFVNRAFMLDYKLVFEQKSTEGNGDGFHIHLVCNTKHRSKGELLRDTQSSFNKVADANCIDVKPTRNPEDMFNKYCIEYASDDGHKIVTKEGDAIWRNKMNLANVYENELPKGIPLLSSSPGQEQNVYHYDTSIRNLKDGIVTFD